MNPRSVLIDFMRYTLSDPATGWVLFDGGTVVTFGASITNPKGYAGALLDRYGSVIPGTPLGDFDVNEIANNWIVTFSHPRILTFVSRAVAREQLGVQQKFEDIAIGLLGRSIREWDAKTKIVIHIEKPRERVRP